MAFTYNDCRKNGLIRKIPPSQEQAEMSIIKALKWISESEKSIKGKAFEASLIASYMAMFHSSRALLFRDGFREKSHACIARYLEEHYVRSDLLDKKWVDLLDHVREIRHSNQYDLGFSTSEKDAAEVLETAKVFTQKMQDLLNKE